MKLSQLTLVQMEIIARLVEKGLMAFDSIQQARQNGVSDADIEKALQDILASYEKHNTFTDSFLKRQFNTNG